MTFGWSPSIKKIFSEFNITTSSSELSNLLFAFIPNDFPMSFSSPRQRLRNAVLMFEAAPVCERKHITGINPFTPLSYIGRQMWMEQSKFLRFGFCSSASIKETSNASCMMIANGLRCHNFWRRIRRNRKKSVGADKSRMNFLVLMTWQIGDVIHFLVTVRNWYIAATVRSCASEGYLGWWMRSRNEWEKFSFRSLNAPTSSQPHILPLPSSTHRLNAWEMPAWVSSSPLFASLSFSE